MKITKAKYNWLVAQYNYRKNKEQFIEISDEEYERLTNNSGIIDDEIIDKSIYFEKIIHSDYGSGDDVDIQDLPDNNNAYTVCGNELLGIEKLHDVYVKYSNDTYKEITHQIKYHLDKNIGILKSTGVSSLTYYPPESIDEDTIDLQIIGEYNGYVFNWTKIKLYSNIYPSQFPIIIGTWNGNMAQIENYRFGIDETSYIESEITFLNNDKTYDGEIYNGIWTTYYNECTYISHFNWNFNNNGTICINFDDGCNGEITRYDLWENRFRGVFCDVFCDNIEEVGSFDLYKFNNSYQCNFIFDTSLHPLPCLLTNILDNSGHFCKITIQIRNGIKHLHITSNYDCAFEDIPLTTEIENQHNYTLGINNCIIVGKSSYDNILVAYDGCCPNCNDKELQWTNNSSQLSCGDCKLSYDVNNGVIINGNGKQLLKYLCDYNGTILRVWN